MKTNLPRTTLLVLFAAISIAAYFYIRYASAKAKEASASSNSWLNVPVDQDKAEKADYWLAQTIEKLENYPSISANVRYRSDLYGNQLGGTGKYLEQRSGPIPKVHLKLEMPLEDKMGALVEVCDGRYLWTYRRLIDDEKLTRIYVQRIAEEMDNSDGHVPMQRLTGTIGMGGLAGLIRELNRNFRFEFLGESQFQNEPSLQLRGRWRPRPLADVLSDQKEAILRGEQADLTKLPPHLPTHVILTLGRDNLLPYRVEYCRNGSVEDNNRLQNLSQTEEENEGVSLEWFNISVTDLLQPSDFEYYPGDVKWSDVTDSLIKRLKARAKTSEAK